MLLDSNLKEIDGGVYFGWYDLYDNYLINGNYKQHQSKWKNCCFTQ